MLPWGRRAAVGGLQCTPGDFTATPHKMYILPEMETHTMFKLNFGISSRSGKISKVCFLLLHEKLLSAGIVSLDNLWPGRIAAWQGL
jgi:hypothetical protein